MMEDRGRGRSEDGGVGNNSQYYNEQYPIPSSAGEWQISPSIRKHWKNARTIGYVCHNEEEMSNI